MELFALNSDFVLMLLRLLLSILVTWFIIDRLYYPKSKRRDFYFTFQLISVAIFLIVFFMIFVLEDMKGKTSMGIGIGLFGIFSIMRYRTDSMPVREMTYLFIIIALAVVNAVAVNVSWLELFATNAIVILAVWICERNLKTHPYKLVQYDRIELAKPGRRDELVADLRERTGLDILSVEVGALDLLKDTAMVKVYYRAESDEPRGTIHNQMRLRKSDRTEFRTQ